jgi:uncharacterized protein YyaL (SSP411 family)
LITRTKDFYDNAIPAGNSVAAHVLLRLALFTGEDRYRELAGQILRLMKNFMLRAPSAFGHLLCALDLYLASSYEIAIIGDPSSGETKALINEVFEIYLPNKVVALAAPGDREAARQIKLLEHRHEVDGKATAYVCRNFFCEAPVTDPAGLKAQLS